MKIKSIEIFGFISFIVLFTSNFAIAQSDALSDAVLPTLATQPSSQSVEHGSDIAFAVNAKGSNLRYQWLKDGKRLFDYDNVAGANSPQLTLVGVAQNDAAKYSVVVSNSVGAVTSSIVSLTVNAAQIFADDFESGLDKWSLYYDSRRLPESTNTSATKLTKSPSKNHSPTGAFSALTTQSSDKMFHNLGKELYGRVKATFWIYDNGSPRSRFYGELRGYTGPGHTTYAAPGGLKQSLAIGSYAISFGDKNTGTLAGERVNPTKYQARVDRGRNTGWFNLDGEGSPDRSEGWHKFEIERCADGTNVNFYVDGSLSRTISGANFAPLDSIFIGSTGAGTGYGVAWFDDVSVEADLKISDWQNLDTAANGVPDWLKLREVGLATSIGQISTVAETQGSAANATVGAWIGDRNGLLSKSARGSLDYQILNAPADDMYRIEIEAQGRNSQGFPIEEIPLVVSIDGEYLGQFLLPYSANTNTFVHCFTPFIKAGPHTIRILWDNAHYHNSLHLEAVRLQTIAGADSDSNGMKDWVENRLYSQNRVDDTFTSSAVSPACVEGKAQFLSMMAITAASDSGSASVPVQHGAGDRWFADIPLSSKDATKIEVRYQNGGLSETREIKWRVTNLLLANDLVIRKGDSLLLTALPDSTAVGTVDVTINGLNIMRTDEQKPVEYRFAESGSYTVTGTFYPTGATRTITIKVLEAKFDGTISAWVGHRRYWDCTNMPSEVFIDSDPRLSMSAVGKHGNQYSITAESTEPRYVLARIGKNGPILASTTVDGFRFFNDADTWLQLENTFKDGSELIDAGFILSPVRTNVTVKSKVIVSGVTFEDGTLEKTLTANDFDSLGVCHLRFIRAPGVKTSVCHATKVLQGNRVIGWPVYVK